MEKEQERKDWELLGLFGQCHSGNGGAAGAGMHCLQSPPALEPQAAAVTVEVSQKPEATNPDPPLRSYRAKGRELQINVMPPVCLLCESFVCVLSHSVMSDSLKLYGL